MRVAYHARRRALPQNLSQLHSPVKLPFLKNKHWPRIGKIAGESRYGYSEETDLTEKALDELLAAHGSMDGPALLEALHALLQIIETKESHDADAYDEAQ